MNTYTGKRILMLLMALSFSHLILAQNSTESESVEPTETGVEVDKLVVVGDASQVELTQNFDGDQVARGGRAGLLGNLDYLDSPFSGTAFTQELIQAQQAESVGDVLLNEPSVRVTKGFGNFQEVYVIRGFPVFSDDITLNGLYGILPRQFVAAEQLERIEVFRGANAFINGAAPGGSGSGGSVNLVSKRAPNEGVRQLSLGFQEAGEFYAAGDYAIRFGGDNEWGIRVNTAVRDGEYSIEDQNREMSMLSFGTDYRGERFRFSADIGYQDNHIDNPRPQVTPLGPIPVAPDADANYAQPGTFTDEQQLFGVARGELDLTDNITAWAAIGGRQGDEHNILANPNAAENGDTSAYRFDNTREDDVFSADVGLRGRFVTGSVSHSVVLSASTIDLESNNAYALSSFVDTFTSNLYNPTPLAELPAADFFVGGTLANPLKTEASNNTSFAVADTIGFAEDRLLVTLGARHQKIETQSFDYNSGEQIATYDDSKVTPVMGIVYKATENMSWYGNYAENLQPGAIAPATDGGTTIENAGEILKPFNGDQVEVGVKYDGYNYGLTAALFSVSRQNAIVEDQVFQASGEQRNKGLELNVFGELNNNIRLLGGISYIEAEFEKTQGGVNEGNTAIGVPELQFNMNGEWDITAIPGLTLDARFIYTDEQFANEANTVRVKNWNRLDLGARYATVVGGKEVTFRGRFNNILDKRYWASVGGFPGANYLIQGDPRTVSVTMSVNL